MAAMIPLDNITSVPSSLPNVALALILLGRHDREQGCYDLGFRMLADLVNVGRGRIRREAVRVESRLETLRFGRRGGCT